MNNNRSSKPKMLSKLQYMVYKKSIRQRKLVIAIDFDGTITDNADAWPEATALKENAKDVINYLHDELNCEIIIWTCRDNSLFDDLSIATEFLRINDIHYDYINENSKLLIKRWGNNTRKIFADIYIDDKALLGNTLNWNNIKKYITKFKKDNLMKYI